jgi:hypothetical protein
VALHLLVKFGRLLSLSTTLVATAEAEACIGVARKDESNAARNTFSDSREGVHDRNPEQVGAVRLMGRC